MNLDFETDVAEIETQLRELRAVADPDSSTKGRMAELEKQHRAGDRQAEHGDPAERPEPRCRIALSQQGKVHRQQRKRRDDQGDLRQQPQQQLGVRRVHHLASSDTSGWTLRLIMFNRQFG